MLIDHKTRKRLSKILKGTTYRKVVSERAQCSPNMVGNILKSAPKVETVKTRRVEMELLAFAKEVLETHHDPEAEQKAKEFTKQLYTLSE